jgi:transcriptional regulator with XRE-family HTH domain
VDLPLLIKHRLKELRRGQKELAAAAQVTESYISQLLKGRKGPPAPGRTDIYDRIERFLRLPPDTLAQMADVQRTDALKKKLADPPTPLFTDVRGLILRKCEPRTEKAVRAIFERESFGALERLVTQKLLDVAQRVARQELRDENWLRLVARHSGRSYRQIRVIIFDFLDTDVFNLSVENCVTFLEPLIESWDIDLATFGMDIVLNQRLVPPRISRGSLPERRRDGGRNRVSQEAAVHA